MDFDFTLVSRTLSSAGQGGNDGQLISWSPDGRFFLFSSYSSAIPAADGKPNNADYYVYDTQTGGISLVTRTAASAATAANGDASDPRFLANGRILFSDNASDMAVTDTNGHADLFLFNPYDGTTALVSHTAGSQTTSTSGGVGLYGQGISADGQYILVEASSAAIDMAASDTNGNRDLYLYDVGTGNYDLVTNASGNTNTTVASLAVLGYVFAPDGNHAAYDLQTLSSELGYLSTAYLYDRVAHGQISMSVGGYNVTVSRGFSTDGRYLVYEAATKTSLGTSEAAIRLYDTQTNTSTLVSHVYNNQGTPTGDHVNIGYGSDVWFSPDSKSLLISSGAADLAQTDTNNAPDLFLYNVSTHDLDLVTHAYGLNQTAGAAANSTSIEGYSDNSRYLLYSSNITTLANSDTNGAWDYFLYDRQTHNNIIVGQASSGTATTGNGSYTSTHANWISPDGKYLLFFTNSSNIAASDTSGSYDTFLLNIETGTTRLVSHALGADSGTAIGAALAVADNLQDDRLSPYSADGRYILLYTNDATPFTSDHADHSNGGYGDDLFLYDIQDGSLDLITHAAGSPTVTANSYNDDGVFTADGKYVVFTSYASNLVGSDPTTNTANVFIYEIATGTTTLVTRTAGGLSGNNNSNQAFVSPDGSHLVFYSGASNLNGSNRTSGSGYDVYITDLPSGVAPANAAPTGLVFTNTIASIVENTSTSSHIGIADIGVTDDGQGTNILTLSGADAARFEIVGGDLYLRAGTKLDYETKSCYGVTVLVDDASVGTTPDATKSLTLTVTNANDSPVIKSNGGGSTASTSVPENKTAVLTALATDADGHTLHYSIAGGADAARFTINGSTGALAFITPADFEKPNDSNHDRFYVVTIGVSDGHGGTDQQTVTVGVTDVKGVVLQATSGNNTIDATHPFGGKVPGAEADSLKGLGGNDTIKGLGGNDTLVGGQGKDLLAGGTDSDRFVFAKGDSGIKTSNVDTISDWSTADSIDTSIAGKAANYYEHSVSSSVDTIEEAAAYAEAHATSSAIAHVFLYNSSKDVGFLLMDLDNNDTFETGVILSHSGQAGDFSYADLV